MPGQRRMFGKTLQWMKAKRAAQDVIREEAERCHMPYVNHRWLGGMLTNWRTISTSIRRLRELESRLGEQQSGLTKKELLRLRREKEKLETTLGGIRDMQKLPSAVWVVDTNKEHLAVAEAKKLGIPVVAVLDTNCDPDEVDFPIPGNDDAIRAVRLYIASAADSVLESLQT